MSDMENMRSPSVSSIIFSKGNNKLLTQNIIRQIPVYRASFIIFSGSIGAGMLIYPYLYAQVGSWQYALLLQFAVMVLMFGSYVLIAICLHYSNCTNFFEMTEFYIGKYSNLFIKIDVAVSLFGAAIAYNILLKNQIHKAIIPFLPVHCKWYCDENFLFVVISVVLYFPLLIPRSLKALSYTSIIGFFGILYTAFAILAKYILKEKAHEIEPIDTKIELQNMLYILAPIIFSFQNHVPTASVFSEMKEDKISHYCIAAFISTIMCGVVYALCGVSGFLMFGSSVKDDIFLNFSSKDIAITVGRILFLIMLTTNYALTAYAGRLAIHKLLEPLVACIKKYRENKFLSKEGYINADNISGVSFISENISEINLTKHKNQEKIDFDHTVAKRIPWIISAVLWQILTIVITIVYPKFGSLLSIVGALSSIIVFVIPGCCLIALCLSKSSRISTSKFVFSCVISIFFISFGVFVLVLSLTESIRKLL